MPDARFPEGTPRTVGARLLTGLPLANQKPRSTERVKTAKLRQDHENKGQLNFKNNTAVFNNEQSGSIQ